MAERMDALGYGWRQQTVAAAERDRRVTAGELLGLALALETSIRALLGSGPDVRAVALPSGLKVPAVVISQMTKDYNDGWVQWEENFPTYNKYLWDDQGNFRGLATRQQAKAQQRAQGESDEQDDIR